MRINWWRLRCALGLHKYSRWGSPKKVWKEVWENLQSTFYWIQDRRCGDCNRLDSRKLTGDLKGYHPISGKVEWDSE